jgi:hypothetical protein
MYSLAFFVPFYQYLYWATALTYTKVCTDQIQDLSQSYRSSHWTTYLFHSLGYVWHRLFSQIADTILAKTARSLKPFTKQYPLS